MKTLLKKFVLTAFCLLVVPATALADGVLLSSCGNANINAANPHPILGPCALPGGGSAMAGAQATAGVNNFRNTHSPVAVMGGVGQLNVFTMTVITSPIWTVPGPVPTRLSLSGQVFIFDPAASVNIQFTGLLGGPPLSINATFNVSGVFSVTVVGDQAIAAAAVSTLTITITGAALLVLPDSGEFEGAIPEPATLLLLGTGLTGIAMKLRKRRAKGK